MFSIMAKPSSLLIVTTLILVILPFLPSSSAEDEFEEGILEWGSHRSILEGDKTPLVLAAKSTRRKDPLNHFKDYTGGWNITDKHYGASLAFSGIPFFVVAALWFVLFGLFLLLACCYCCCCNKKTYGYSRFCYALSLSLLCGLLVCIIAGSALLYTGESNLNKTTKHTYDYITSVAVSTSDNLQNISRVLSDVKKTGYDKLSLPKGVQDHIDSVTGVMRKAAAGLGDVPTKNKDKVFKVFDIVKTCLIVLAAIMLVVSLVGFLLSLCGMQFLVSLLVIVGWILVTLAFILCGVFLLLGNAVTDTCGAMKEYVDHPQEKSALGDIIPCVNPKTAEEIYTGSKEVTYQIVEMLNMLVKEQPKNVYAEGPPVPFLCNPYNGDKTHTDRKCAPGEVELSNAAQVWKKSRCEKEHNGVCASPGRITPKMYDQAMSFLNLADGVNRYTPFMLTLINCQFVRDTFTRISYDYCPGLSRNLKWVYIGLTIVATGVMLSLIFWFIYARERRHRKYTKSIDAASFRH